jgi:hypothetical protein
MDESLTPEQRSLRAKIAAYSSWAKTADRAGRTAAARRAALDRFDREVDPDGVLPAEERAQRSACARKAHYSRMAYLSARARRSGRSFDRHLEP